ncbi:MAG: hypothetical protein EBU01_14245 [Crocinitomicaceae bacterium]|nr:hypothetical protein [Crocinitomicaceae bacterium]
MAVNYTEYIKGITESRIKSALFIVFLLFVIVPVEIPHFVSNFMNSFLGIFVVIIITIYLFLYVSPILAILYIFVGYKLLQHNNYYYKPIYAEKSISNATKDEELQKLNPPREKTLEEEMVEKVVPMQFNVPNITSSFVPVYSKVQSGASVWN